MESPNSNNDEDLSEGPIGFICIKEAVWSFSYSK